MYPSQRGLWYEGDIALFTQTTDSLVQHLANINIAKAKKNSIPAATIPCPFIEGLLPLYIYTLDSSAFFLAFLLALLASTACLHCCPYKHTAHKPPVQTTMNKADIVLNQPTPITSMAGRQVAEPAAANR